MSFMDVMVQYKSLFLHDIHRKDYGKLELPRELSSEKSRCVLSHFVIIIALCNTCRTW